MSNLLEYKDYLGTVEYSSSDKVLYGKVIGINGLVSYEGDSIESLQADLKRRLTIILKCALNKVLNLKRHIKGLLMCEYHRCSIKILQNLPRHITKR